jgi:squalene-hopene/tetraprenyl-beta-curcumene cyclase
MGTFMMVPLSCVGLLVSAIQSAPPSEPPAMDFAIRNRAHQAVDRGVAFLAASQAEDGGWEAFGKSHIGVSALVVKALAQDEGYGPKHPVVQRGVDFLLRFSQPDGGIYAPEEGMRNYHASVALMALSSLRDPSHRERIEKAQRFLKQLQWDDGEGHEASSTWYGGQGYGSGKRPDLSNTQLMIEALHDSGLQPDDAAYRKAMVFISRCQMLGAFNDQPFAAGAADGGFVYSPVNGGESKAGTTLVDGQPRLRSYGSMTYAGFKSMLYAKVDRDDPRVRAAVDWITRNYTLAHNPNMPEAKSKEGLYYFYHVFARAMLAWGKETITDSTGVAHRWREELCETLITLQQKDGSWVNEADRWYEGNPHLVTAYVVLALQTALSR